jgi:hypothetical protein
MKGQGRVSVIDSYAALTKLMRLFGAVCMFFVAVFVVCELLSPAVSRLGLPSWGWTLWSYATRYALGFAGGAGIIALLYWQERSTLKP